MLRKTAQIWLLFSTFFCFITTSHAQTTQLDWPNNFEIIDDALHWDAVENALGYRVRRLGISERDWITVEVSQNRFDLHGLEYGYTFYTVVQAISGDPNLYQDSIWSSLFTLIRPFPTATPTNTPTNTPSPTPTRVFLKGIGTPQNVRPLSGGVVAWDPVVGAVSYSLFISGDDEIHSANVVAPQTEFSLTNLNGGKTYSVQVSAQGNGQTYESQGRYSKFIKITLPSVATSTPTATNTATNTPTATDSPTRQLHLPTRPRSQTVQLQNQPTPLLTRLRPQTAQLQNRPAPLLTRLRSQTVQLQNRPAQHQTPPDQARQSLKQRFPHRRRLENCPRPKTSACFRATRSPGMPSKAQAVIACVWTRLMPIAF